METTNLKNVLMPNHIDWLIGRWRVQYTTIYRNGLTIIVKIVVRRKTGPAGNEIEVTSVTPDPSGKGYDWDDKVPMGPVRSFIRLGRVDPSSFRMLNNPSGLQ